MSNADRNNSIQSLEQLQTCLSLAKHTATHQEAEERFLKLRDRLVEEGSELATVMDVMWKEILSSRRSAFFWEEMCNVEQKLTERMAESHVQLRQNYLRLVQEQ